MAKFELSLGSFTLKVGRDSTTVSKSSSSHLYNFEYLNGRLDSVHNFFNINSSKTIIKAVNECPQVSTIIFRKGQAQANGSTTLTYDNGKPLRGADKTWERVITKPNAFQNRAQYITQLTQFLESYNYCFERKIIPIGFAPQDMVRQLLDPQYCDITWRKVQLLSATKRSDLIEKFAYTENGVQVEFTREQIDNLYCYVKPNKFAYNSGYLPTSQLTTLENDINACIANLKHRIRAISSPWGFISNDSVDAVGATQLLSEPERKEFLEKYHRSYGTGDGQSELVFAPRKVSFTSVMPPSAALQLLEMLKSSQATICDVMGWEYDLLARDLGGVALNNKNEANKLSYQNHIIPERKNIDEQERESLGLDKLGIFLTTTFTHLPVFQENLKESSEVRKNDTQSVMSQFISDFINYDEVVTILRIKNINPDLKGKFFSGLTPEQQALFTQQHTTNGSNNTGSGTAQNETNNTNQTGN